jgi:hypothetical protein
VANHLIVQAAAFTLYWTNWHIPDNSKALLIIHNARLRHINVHLVLIEQFPPFGQNALCCRYIRECVSHSGCGTWSEAERKIDMVLWADGHKEN